MDPRDSLRAVAGALVELAGTRIELALVELREQGELRKQLLVLAVTAVLFLSMAALLLAGLVVVFFWDMHRLAAAGGMTLLYLALGLAALARLRHRERNAPHPFEATLAELARDAELLRARHE